ncbi:DUF2163 domain-containing protein [Candidatus Anaplasma sp. TIGMIC]|uniref:DUF2163 domain-containing protein n=1 Tax=Candidatus Anaplasma sp. TIGMIC TaxID=3020713 RepID=UPI00232F32D9|nr:DUF2163 domain-containing protein [Candidatus Anaplasma sp. TIGMIC]MDB1135100.1 DUF2163 domain-containing protein [Candidatus Anaplasma sp. TIGMIC]
MKAIPDALLSHLSKDVTTVAFCFKMTLKDSSVVCFTNCDVDLTIGGLIYRSNTSAKIKLVHFSKWNSTAHIECMHTRYTITADSAHRGLYNSAQIEIFLVNYADTSKGAITLFRGTVGEIKLCNGVFSAQLHGLTLTLSNKVGDLFSPQCRAQFCDSACKLNAERFTFRGSAFKVLEDYKAFESEVKVGKVNYFKYGVLTFLTGRNKKIPLTVLANTQNAICLAECTPYPIQVGDNYSLLAGCDKNFHTCVKKFENAKNFRGEPHVPDLHTVYAHTTGVPDDQ